jgi:inhibitor of KinA
MASKLIPRIQPFGDNGILIGYDVKGYSETACKTVHALGDILRGQDNIWTNVIPAYDSLMVTFNPMVTEAAAALRKVEEAYEKISKRLPRTKTHVIEVPVYYGGESGPDMQNICKSSKLSEDQVIKRHSKITYRVCLMGFIPGFAFLSETDKKLHHPRHETPRGLVPPGSIGIANWQTGIYGLESPGGWQIIGRTPLSVFDPKRETPFALKAGDMIRFVPQGAPS